MTTARLAKVDRATGQIVGYISGESADLARDNVQELLLLGDWDRLKHYLPPEAAIEIPVCIATPVLRPAMEAVADKAQITADGADTVTITGLPVPCVATIDGTDYSVDDGSLTFATTEPGLHEITIVAWPYLDGVFAIRAV